MVTPNNTAQWLCYSLSPYLIGKPPYYRKDKPLSHTSKNEGRSPQHTSLCCRGDRKTAAYCMGTAQLLASWLAGLTPVGRYGRGCRLRAVQAYSSLVCALYFSVQLLTGVSLMELSQVPPTAPKPADMHSNVTSSLGGHWRASGPCRAILHRGYGYVVLSNTPLALHLSSGSSYLCFVIPHLATTVSSRH